MTKREKIRTDLKRNLQDFLKENCPYNETERENAEVCEKFLLPVDEKYEAYNLKWPQHSERKEGY